MAGDGSEATWLTARRAVELLLADLYDHPAFAHNTLIEKAALGTVRTRCRLMVEEDDGDEVDREENYTVPDRFWRRLRDAKGVFRERVDFAVGDFTVSYRSASGIGRDRTRVEGVMFNESDLRAFVNPDASPIETPYDTAAEAVSAALVRVQEVLASTSSGQPATPSLEKTRVSNATLAAWWALYKTLREPHERSDPDMERFFERCLPDKGVSRARLRAIRGAQTPGPKRRAAE